MLPLWIRFRPSKDPPLGTEFFTSAPLIAAANPICFFVSRPWYLTRSDILAMVVSQVLSMHTFTAAAEKYGCTVSGAGTILGWCSFLGRQPKIVVRPMRKDACISY